MMMTRRYPVGIQTFSRIRQGEYVYVDKTDLVWQLCHYAKYIFMSRPRRFGKSLLTSTLESYFRGERGLFEGLKIMWLEQEWEQYPTVHLDLSSTKHMKPSDVIRELEIMLSPYEAAYGTNEQETTPGMRLSGIIERAYAQTHKQVAVIIDEYDAPLLDVLHEDDRLKEIREVMQEFYQRLKKLEPKIKFCFITGITKFSQLSIFSPINNQTNVTMDSVFAALCGITEEELTTTLRQDVERLAEAATKEGFYEYTLYLIFSMLNVYAKTQVKVAGGRVDMVVWMPDTVYIFELKVCGTAQEAPQQIDGKGYAFPYQADGRRVVKVGVRFNADTRVPEDWVIAE